MDDRMADRVEPTGPRARSAAARAPANTRNVLEVAAWCLLLFWLTSPWQLLLSGANPVGRTAIADINSLYSYANDVTGLIPACVIAFERDRSIAFLRRCWPFAGFLLLTALLLMTAQDPRSSLIRFVGLVTGALSVFALFVRLASRDALRCLAYVLIASFALSIATALLMPRYGVTGVADIYGDGAGGEWRGLYPHKNILGQYAGIGFGLLLVTGRRLLRSTVLWLIGLGLAAICVVKAGSSTGLVLAVALPAIYFGLLRPKGLLRIFGAIGVGVVGVLVLMFRGPVVDSILKSLGKGDTLSGRTDVWHVAGEFATQYPITGAGYDYTVSGPMVARFEKLFGIPNAHNAYLDLLINLGWLDSAVLAAAVMWALVAAWSRRLPEQATATRDAFTLMLAAWLISGTDEVMAVKPDGPIANLGLLAIFGLFSLRRYGEKSRRRGASEPSPSAATVGRSSARPSRNADLT